MKPSPLEREIECNASAVTFSEFFTIKMSHFFQNIQVRLISLEGGIECNASAVTFSEFFTIKMAHFFRTYKWNYSPSKGE